MDAMNARFTVTLPRKDNDGESLLWLHARLQRTLVTRYRAYSSVEVSGQWEQHQDRSTRYEVLLLDDPAQRAWWRRLARTLAEQGEQECVLLTFEPVHAELVCPR